MIQGDRYFSHWPHISHMVKPAIWHWVHETRLELGCIFGAHLDPPSKPGGSHCLPMPGNWLICIPTVMASSILQCIAMFHFTFGKTSNNLKIYTSSLCRTLRANSNLVSSQAKSPIVIYTTCRCTFDKKWKRTNNDIGKLPAFGRSHQPRLWRTLFVGEVIAFCIAHILYQQLCASCVELRREGSD